MKYLNLKYEPSILPSELLKTSILVFDKNSLVVFTSDVHLISEEMDPVHSVPLQMHSYVNSFTHLS